MFMNISEIYIKIIESLNEIEKKYSEYYIYTDNGFVKYKSSFNSSTLSLIIKIKENRIMNFQEILNNLNINFEISNENKYYKVYKINNSNNYIILDYIVNSHVTIPNSFLEHFRIFYQ